MAESETNGLLSFADAVKAARASRTNAEVQEVAPETTQAVVEEVTVADQAPVQDVLEHPTVAPDDASRGELSVFADVEDELLVRNPFEQGGIDANQFTEVPVDGFDSPIRVHSDDAEQVSELAKGYLRQADYTRKTQELAEQRKSFDVEQGAASKLLQALRDDPGGTIASLAVEVGLIEKDQLSADIVARINADHRVPSREDVERQIEERALSLLESDPRIREAEDAKVWDEIQKQFASIEQDEGVTFSKRDKELVLQHAVDNDIHRVDLAYLDLKRKAERTRAQRKQAAQAAPASSQKGRVTDSTSKLPSGPARSVAEAWARSKADGVSVGK